MNGVEELHVRNIMWCHVGESLAGDVSFQGDVTFRYGLTIFQLQVLGTGYFFREVSILFIGDLFLNPSVITMIILYRFCNYIHIVGRIQIAVS
jgi:hypothetical protein